MKRSSLVLSLTAILVIVFLLGGAAAIWAFKYYPGLVCNKACQSAITKDKKFFADEIFISGRGENNEPFLLRLDLNRKKVGAVFQHYYYADLVYKNNQRQLYTNFLSANSKVEPKDFLKMFLNKISSDLSARESYEFNFVFENLNLSAKLNNFQGDFLVKNTLEYTKYVSEGLAEINLNGQVFTMHSAIAKIYSDDYDKYVFFDGYSNLQSVAQFFALWDSQGNFYLLDTSNVKSEQPNYRSHTWVLYKDRNGFIKKAFSAEVGATAPGDVADKWEIYIPDLATRLSLKPFAFAATNKTRGLAQGTVTTSASVPIEGYFSYERYGK